MKWPFDKYHWFDVARRDAAEGWILHAAKLAAYEAWCIENMGNRRLNGPWVILDSNDRPLHPNRSYNVQNFFSIGIEDPELAVLFRLKFNK